MILFDTDTCIGILRGYDSVLARRRTVDDEVAVSFMTVAELYFGAQKSSNPDRNFTAPSKLPVIAIARTDPMKAFIGTYGTPDN